MGVGEPFFSFLFLLASVLYIHMCFHVRECECWFVLWSMQRYLTSFRVLELKELLKNQGQSTKGRKPELFQRANDILQFGSPKFQTKIREIYERSNNFRRQLSYNRTAQKTSPEKSRESVVKKASRPYIVHPDVKFKSHPFFSKLETIIRPTALSNDIIMYI